MAKQKASKVEAIITSKPKQAKASQALADKMLVSLKATLQDTGLTLTPEQLESIKSQQQEAGLVASSSRTKYTGERYEGFVDTVRNEMAKASDENGLFTCNEGTFVLDFYAKLVKPKTKQGKLKALKHVERQAIHAKRWGLPQAKAK